MLCDNCLKHQQINFYCAKTTQNLVISGFLSLWQKLVFLKICQFLFFLWVLNGKNKYHHNFIPSVFKIILSKEIHMMEISRLMQVGRLRITLFFNSWEAATNLFAKEKTLSIKKGRGAKSKLKEVWAILLDLVKENSRNLKVVVGVLAKEHQVFFCKCTVKKFLKSARL